MNPDLTLWQCIALGLTVPAWMVWGVIFTDMTDYTVHWTISCLGCLLIAAGIVLL